MKTIHLLLVVFVSSLFLHPSSFGQGILTPPAGAPAPTMKSLDQIEPRTPISSAPFNVNSAGSYYLTANLTVNSGNAITINSDNVTLDLNGFTVSSTASPAGGTGVFLNGGRRDITILNGHIKGAVIFSGGSYSGNGFSNGIYYSGVPFNVRVSGVSVGGCLSKGIAAGGNSSVVESCVVNTVGDTGISGGIVSRSIALQCGNTSIGANTASDCWGQSNGANGVSAANVLNCYGEAGPGGTGISGSAVNNSHGLSSGVGGYGVLADIVTNSIGSHDGSGGGIYGGKIVMGCFGESNSGIAIDAFIAISSTASTTSGTAFNTIHRYLTGLGPDS